MGAKGMWLKVRGPLAALQATLLDLGWHPKEVWNWIDPSGQEWELDPNDGSLWQDLRHELQKTITKQVWTKAAEHYLGLGLEAG
eukprot:6430646-Heterocapsa_arctica.AAC.1